VTQVTQVMRERAQDTSWGRLPANAMRTEDGVSNGGEGCKAACGAATAA
jgi:hypothetical protein